MLDYFATIESAAEYLTKLEEVLNETKAAIATETPSLDQRTKRYNGLMIAHYKLERLTVHLKRSAKLLDDLRRLERLCSQKN